MDATKLTPGYEFLEGDRAVKVQVEVPEGLSVIFELLLEPDVDLPEYLLDVLQIFFSLWVAPVFFVVCGFNLVFSRVALQLNRIFEVDRAVRPFLREHGASVVDLNNALQFLKAEHRIHGPAVVVAALAEVSGKQIVGFVFQIWII